MTSIGLVEDGSIMGESLADRFHLEGIDACWCKSAEEAEERLNTEHFALVVCDIRLPGMRGDALFERLRGRRPVLPPFVFITGFGDLDRAEELPKLGAADYITKPFDLDKLLTRVRDLTNTALAPGGKGHQHGISPAMSRVDGLLARLAPLDVTVLIRGETGTGKEVVARRLHQLSDRVRGGRSPRLPTEPCVRVRTRLLTQGVSTDAHQTSAVTACPSEWLVPAPQ
jgi:DNA-binding NtrC family response regulator